MLNPFPTLLVLGFFAPLVLRAVTGFIFLSFASRHAKHRTALAASLRGRLGSGTKTYIWSLILLEIVVGALLIAGFYTQIAALVGIVVILKGLLMGTRFAEVWPHSPLLHILLLAVLVSLLFSGAGALAIDIPL